MNSYPLGNLIRVSASFAIAGVATDPTAVTCKVRTPAGTITTYTYGTDAALVRDDIGIYHVDVTASSAGIWDYRFAGTGACVAATEAEFFIEPSDFGANG